VKDDEESQGGVVKKPSPTLRSFASLQDDTSLFLDSFLGLTAVHPELWQAGG
jgi:hypothetical protein